MLGCILQLYFFNPSTNSCSNISLQICNYTNHATQRDFFDMSERSQSSLHCLQDYRRGARGSETEATTIPGLWRKRRRKGDDLLSETLPPLKSDTLVLVKENYLNSKASRRFHWQIARLCLDFGWNHLVAHLHNHPSPGRWSFLQRCLCDD